MCLTRMRSRPFVANTLKKCKLFFDHIFLRLENDGRIRKNSEKSTEKLASALTLVWVLLSLLQNLKDRNIEKESVGRNWPSQSWLPGLAGRWWQEQQQPIWGGQCCKSIVDAHLHLQQCENVNTRIRGEWGNFFALREGLPSHKFPKLRHCQDGEGSDPCLDFFEGFVQMHWGPSNLI